MLVGGVRTRRAWCAEPFESRVFLEQLIEQKKGTLLIKVGCNPRVVFVVVIGYSIKASYQLEAVFSCMSFPTEV